MCVKKASRSEDLLVLRCKNGLRNRDRGSPAVVIIARFWAESVVQKSKVSSCTWCNRSVRHDYCSFQVLRSPKVRSQIIMQRVWHTETSCLSSKLFCDWIETKSSVWPSTDKKYTRGFDPAL
jgi:hypothetical protein